MGDTPEGKIKIKLDRVLKRHKVWFFSPQAGIFGKSGVPDRIAIVGGAFVGIECKADKTKKLTALQNICKGKIEDAGGKYFTVYDEFTINEVANYINASLRK